MARDTNGGQDVRIDEFGAHDEQDLADVARLHMELLDYGPMAGLGLRFIREVGYRLHMEEGVLRVAICRVDSEAAGFVAYTSRSLDFHRQSLATHWLRISRVLAGSLLDEPRRIVNLMRALKVVGSRRSEIRRDDNALGEIVSIAVRREYLRTGCVDSEGRRLSVALVAHCQEKLRAAGVQSMRMLVDADNRSALFMYHAMGARMEPYRQAGEPMVEVQFDIRK